MYPNGSIGHQYFSSYIFFGGDHPLICTAWELHAGLDISHQGIHPDW